MQKKVKMIAALVGIGVVVTATVIFSRTFVKNTSSQVPDTPAATAVTSAPAPGKAPAVVSADGWSTEDFRLGNLYIGMTEEELFRTMGKPTTVSTFDQGLTRSLDYPGLDVGTVYLSDKGIHVVSGFRVEAAAYPTFRGIKVGATKAQVEAVYGPSGPIAWLYPEMGFEYTNTTLCEPGYYLNLAFETNKDQVVVSISVSKGIDWSEKDFLLAGVEYGMPEKEVVQALGTPSSMQNTGSGLIYEYPGVTVKFQTRTDGFAVQEVVVTTPDYPTSRGIKIGDPRDRVKQIYDLPVQFFRVGSTLRFDFNPDNTLAQITLFYEEPQGD